MGILEDWRNDFLGRISLAIHCFFSILFGNRLPEEAARLLPRQEPPKPAAPPQPVAGPADGAVQILSILQRDARLVDFLVEDLSGYTDEQVGAAARSLHSQCGPCLTRYLKLAPVIDAVESTFLKLDLAAPYYSDPAALKFLGNVPASGKAPGGILRHKGWRVERIELPPIPATGSLAVIQPAEVEVE